MSNEVESEIVASNAQVEAEMHRMSRNGFIKGALVVAAGAAGLKWLNTRPTNNGVIYPLRRVLETNEKVARALFNPNALAPTFDRKMAKEPRANGTYGLESELVADQWMLRVVGLAAMPAAAILDPDAEVPTMMLTLAELKQFPRFEMVTEFKCIEGWSEIVHWAGLRLADFMAKYAPSQSAQDYVSLSTPDSEYYVGLERASAIHPQTMLCYEMNGESLSDEHGAPLRLVIPVKYGVKNIKRIGTIQYTNTRPPDYWAEQGYDWYDGH